MDRREAVKRISTILGVAISGPTLAGVLGGCQAIPGHIRTLDGKQYNMLSTLTEHIIPTTDTPGAMAAGVPDYIDAMLTDFYSEENRAEFLAGLAEVDDRARESFNADFLDCTSDDQLVLLHTMDEAAFPDLSQLDEERLAEYEAQRAAAGKPFIQRLKELTIAGYYTSEVGATQELHLNPMGEHRGDIPFAEVGRAWA